MVERFGGSQASSIGMEMSSLSQEWEGDANGQHARSLKLR